jgi:NAD(P)-dependent dehydrogenase (short-subunit alcohol dehydrogenase family)
MSDMTCVGVRRGPDAFCLAGRVALVTGGARGIGASVARALADWGARVIIGVRPGQADSEAVNAMLNELTETAGGSDAFAVDLDVRSARDTGRAVDAVLRRCGGIHILVNNAGINVQQPAVEVDEATWDLIVDTNLKGLFFTSQAVGRAMMARPAPDEMGYSIVNVASQMGLVGFARRAAYCASKAGVVNLTRVLAIEWAHAGIRVNAVAPTFVHTPLADAMLADESFRSDILSRSPMGRVGEPADVANGVAYLCSSAARLVTGHTLVIDGGWTAW